LQLLFAYLFVSHVNTKELNTQTVYPLDGDNNYRLRGM